MSVGKTNKAEDYNYFTFCFTSFDYHRLPARKLNETNKSKY